ncbi:unnamed protein product [Ceratitis capitata]|uniref:(Mediterranean fruit fly) hypothetical protein n=1 Tax=Ceratitis capitata TaxID=7213 RepID=A0A811VDL8_CERCA|nr:unnamed protein product [Ceratitis capitata]
MNQNLSQLKSNKLGGQKALNVDNRLATCAKVLTKLSFRLKTNTKIFLAIYSAILCICFLQDKIETAELQQQDVFNRESSEEDQDDAFHRWLTSTEMNANNNNNNSSELDTTSPARRTNLFGLAGTQTINATSTAKTINNTNAPRGAGGGDRGTGGAGGGNRSSNNSKIENVYFRSSYNDYSSEYNGSVVNIDILLTTADEQQQAQQQQQKADLITQPSSSSQKTGERGGTTVSAAANSSSFSSTTALPTAAGSTQTSSPERQCNVMAVILSEMGMGSIYELEYDTPSMTQLKTSGYLPVTDLLSTVDSNNPGSVTKCPKLSSYAVLVEAPLAHETLIILHFVNLD